MPRPERIDGKYMPRPMNTATIGLTSISLRAPIDSPIELVQAHVPILNVTEPRSRFGVIDMKSLDTSDLISAPFD
jgi:hypothetical protein